MIHIYVWMSFPNPKSWSFSIIVLWYQSVFYGSNLELFEYLFLHDKNDLYVKYWIIKNKNKIEKLHKNTCLFCMFRIFILYVLSMQLFIFSFFFYSIFFSIKSILIMKEYSNALNLTHKTHADNYLWCMEKSRILNWKSSYLIQNYYLYIFFFLLLFTF